MRVGNWEFGIAHGKWTWGPGTRCGAGCWLFDLGPFYMTRLAGECRESIGTESVPVPTIGTKEKEDE